MYRFKSQYQRGHADLKPQTAFKIFIEFFIVPFIVYVCVYYLHTFAYFKCNITVCNFFLHRHSYPLKYVYVAKLVAVPQ